MTETTEALIQRWMIAFCEAPIIVDPELMRMVLDGPKNDREPIHDRKDLQGR